MNKAERQNIRDLNALRFSNLDTITVKKAVTAKQEYKQALAKLQAQKNTYTDEYITGETQNIKQKYATALAGMYPELEKDIDSLHTSIQQIQSELDLSDPAWPNALKMIELGVQNAETVVKINESFKHSQPALRVLQEVYRRQNVAYDGGIDKMVYDVDGSFDKLKALAKSTFIDQTTSITRFATEAAKIAKFEGFQFEANPDPDAFGEAVFRGAGLSMPE